MIQHVETSITQSCSWGETAIRLVDASFRIFKTLEHVSYKILKDQHVIDSANQCSEPSGVILAYVQC
jgi:hypothetical protein